jgi:hypothetical protein
MGVATMRKIWSNSRLWGATIVGVLVIVLVLTTAGAGAQEGGDVSPDRSASEPASLDVLPADDGAGMLEAADIAPLAATADISSTITYQGVLRQGDQLANDSFDFRFRLFDDPAAGTQLGEQIASAVAVQNGQFTVPLTFGPDTFAAQAVWLEIAVSPAGVGTYETLEPRQMITAAPLALSLPNVSTNPETGFVSIGGGPPISAFTVLGIHRPFNGWVGMYISGEGPEARPFYGYATGNEGAFEHAWTEYNGATDQWRLYISGAQVFTVSKGGDVSQPQAANGLVKAAAFVECWPDASLLEVRSSFNTVTGTPVTAAVGGVQGECYVDFGFNLSQRFYSATAVQAGAVRGVTCDVDGGNRNRLRCLRWRVNAGAGEGWGGRIMITVY